MLVSELIQNRREKLPKLKKAPGPGVFESVLGLTQHPLQFIYQAVRKYGPIVKIPFLPHSTYIVTSPEAVKRIMKADEAFYDKRVRTYEKLKIYTGDGIATSNGDVWREHQSLTTPSFHNRYMGGFAADFVQQVGQVIAQWEQFAKTGKPINVVPFLHKMSIDIGTKAMLGVDTSADPAPELQEAMNFIFEDGPKRIYGLNPPMWIPTTRNVKTKKAVDVMDDYVYSKIDRRIKENIVVDDFLGRLIDATQRTEGFLVDRKMVRDLAINFLFGNRETSGNMLVWMFYLLAQHPEVDQKLVAEIDNVVGNNPPDLKHFRQDLMPYSMYVIKEALRLYPPAPLLLRRAVQDDVVEGYRIPAGSEVILSPFMTHRDPRFWVDPLKFDPERFAPERIETVPYFAYFPFGVGGHICPGKNFALLEALVALVMIRQKFRIELTSDPVARIKEPAMFLQPEGPINMVLKPVVH